MITKWFLIFWLSTVPLYASLGEEARDYAKALFRVHKELKKENTTTKSINRVILDLRAYNKHFFTVVSADRAKLNKRDNVISDAVFKQQVEELKAYPYQTEAKFLLEYIGKRKPKLYRQLFLHRYMRYKSASFKTNAKVSKLKLLTQIQKIYVEKKKALGKKPSFEELRLPTQLASYKNPSNGNSIPWLYVGDKAYTSEKIQVVAAIPVAASNGRVLAIRENGTATNLLTYIKMKSVMDSKPAVPKDPISSTPEDQQSQQAQVDPLYLELLTSRAAKVIERHNQYIKSDHYDKATSNGVKQLQFKDGEDQYKSADGKNSYPWLYLGATHAIYHSNGKRVICMTVNPIQNDLHVGFCEDSTMVEISPQQYLEIVKNGVAAHSP